MWSARSASWWTARFSSPNRGAPGCGTGCSRPSANTAGRSSASARSRTSPSEQLLRTRHLDWYTSQAAEFDRAWFGPRQPEWLERLDLDLPNIRAALSLAADDPVHVEQGLILAGSLYQFWRVSAIREGEQWLTRLLQVDTQPSTGRARALVALTGLLAARGRPQVKMVADEAQAMAAEFEPSLVSHVMSLRASGSVDGDLASVEALLQATLTQARQAGSVTDVALALHSLAWRLGLAGRLPEAEVYFAETRVLSEEAGELAYLGAMQLRRALVAWMNNDPALMSAAATDSLRASRLVHDRFTSANAVSLIGVLAVGRQDRLAATLFGAAERFWEDADGSIVTTSPWRPLLDEAKARCRSRIGAAAFDDRYGRGRHQPLEDAIFTALGERPEQPSMSLTQRDFGLTRRELEVVELVSEGLTNKEIARRLVISSRTADTHVQNVLSKTGFNTRSQVAAWRTAQVRQRG